MAYPQSSAVQAVLNSQEFWRLKTEIDGAGDIYETEESGLSFVLGPDSDLANVQITYLNDNAGAPSLGALSPGVSQFLLTPERSFVGRIDARIGSYPQSARRGRILITPGDTWRIYNPATIGVGDTLRIVRPVLDVIQYFTDPPSVTPQRSDRNYYFEYYQTPAGAADDTYVVIPSYGRRSGFFTFLNRAAAAVQPFVYGVSLSLSNSLVAPAVNGSFELQLFNNGGNLIAPNSGSNWVFQASQHGAWDLLIVRLDGYLGGSVPVTIQLSDTVL